MRSRGNKNAPSSPHSQWQSSPATSGIHSMMHPMRVISQQPPSRDYPPPPNGTSAPPSQSTQPPPPQPTQGGGPPPRMYPSNPPPPFPPPPSSTSGSNNASTAAAAPTGPPSSTGPHSTGDKRSKISYHLSEIQKEFQVIMNEFHHLSSSSSTTTTTSKSNKLPPPTTASSTSMTKELESKFMAQIQELSSFRQGMEELEQRHVEMKERYEAEIRALKRELETFSHSQPPPPSAPTSGQSQSGHGRSGSSSGLTQSMDDRPIPSQRHGSSTQSSQGPPPPLVQPQPMHLDPQPPPTPNHPAYNQESPYPQHQPFPQMQGIQSVPARSARAMPSQMHDSRPPPGPGPGPGPGTPPIQQGGPPPSSNNGIPSSRPSQQPQQSQGPPAAKRIRDIGPAPHGEQTLSLANMPSPNSNHSAGPTSAMDMQQHQGQPPQMGAFQEYEDGYYTHSKRSAAAASPPPPHQPTGPQPGQIPVPQGPSSGGPSPHPQSAGTVPSQPPPPPPSQIQDMPSKNHTQYPPRDDAKIKEEKSIGRESTRGATPGTPKGGGKRPRATVDSEDTGGPTQPTREEKYTGKGRTRSEQSKNAVASENRMSHSNAASPRPLTAPNPPDTVAEPTHVHGMSTLDLEKSPPELKREGGGWVVAYNQDLRPSITSSQLAPLDLIHTLKHTSVVCCVRFSMDGKYLATGCNRLAQIYNVSTGKRVATLKDNVGKEDGAKEGDLYIRSVCFSPDGRLLATGAEDKLIRIWEYRMNRILKIFEGHEQDIYSLDFSRDGRYIISGSGDRTAKLWNVHTGECMYTFPHKDWVAKDAGVTSVAFSPDTRLIATGSLDFVIRIWDVKTGEYLDRLVGHENSVYSVAFSPDGRQLASGSLDKTLRIWDLGWYTDPGAQYHPETNGTTTTSSGRRSRKSNDKGKKKSNGENENMNKDYGADDSRRGDQELDPNKRAATCRLVLLGHDDFVLSVTFSPDGKWVVSGSKDRGVQFWNARTAKSELVLQGHKNSVISVNLSPTGGVFATGSGDCRARVWRYERPGALQAMPMQVPGAHELPPPVQMQPSSRGSNASGQDYWNQPPPPSTRKDKDRNDKRGERDHDSRRRQGQLQDSQSASTRSSPAGTPTSVKSPAEPIEEPRTNGTGEHPHSAAPMPSSPSSAVEEGNPSPNSAPPRAGSMDMHGGGGTDNVSIGRVDEEGHARRSSGDTEMSTAKSVSSTPVPYGGKKHADSPARHSPSEDSRDIKHRRRAPSDQSSTQPHVSSPTGAHASSSTSPPPEAQDMVDHDSRSKHSSPDASMTSKSDSRQSPVGDVPMEA